MTKEEMKNRISMALKDPILQQGFEIICKDFSELEKENTELKEKLKHRNCVDCSNHASNIKLIKAKEIIRELLSSCFGYNSKTVNYDVKAKAEAFFKEISE